MKRNWSHGPSSPDDELSIWMIMLAAALLLIVPAVIDSFSGQPDIGAEPRSDVIWSERER